MGMRRAGQEGALWLAEQFGDLLACQCGGKLEPNGFDVELVCQECSQMFDYANGILSFQAAPDAGGHAQALELQEEGCRDRQARYYDVAIAASLPSWFESRKIRAALGALSVKTAIEIGCGTGRFTVQLAGRSQRVIAIDRSRVSLQYCRLKLLNKGLSDRVLLIHSDVNQMPVKSFRFDLAIMAQMLQHLPTEDLRRRALESVAETLDTDGRFILSAYEWRGREPFWRKKQGLHRGGIFYLRFTREELKELLAPVFDVHKVESCLGRLWVSFGRRKSGSFPSFS